MEILSPAGNLQHIELAIAKKVDAVYGGVKNWNARNKAVNFSIDEYYDVVKKVHDNGIKFYLTLNTLVFDEEINDIINFLKAKDTILPDAFIVADVGLILKLKKAFPNLITIHVNRPHFESGLAKEELAHPTEHGLDDFHDYDYEIENDGTLEDLKTKVIQILERIDK